MSPCCQPAVGLAVHSPRAGALARRLLAFGAGPLPAIGTTSGYTCFMRGDSVCAYCGTTFKLARRGPIGRACSTFCRRRLYLPATPWRVERTCDQCGKSFLPRHKTTRYCSPRCGWLYRATIRPKNTDWATGRQPERELSCLRCGVTVVMRASQGYCQSCRRITLSDVEARKRHKRRGAVATARYSLVDIGDRDGWRCHLCQRPVDPTLSGRHPMGPTRDHLIPVSAGGVDGPENVRLAHHRCNSRRGAAGTVQLLLIA